jgi:hypothetical protein
MSNGNPSISIFDNTSHNGNSISLRVDENLGTKRTDYFVIKSGSYTERINISQAGKSATHLSVTTDNVSFSSSGGSRSITVSTDGEWRISTETNSWGYTSINGNTITLRVDANDGDLIKAVVDKSKRDNIYDSTTKDIPASDGKSPSYEYPTIPNYQIYEDIENGGSNGNSGGTGHGSFANSNSGTANSNQKGSDNTGNGTHSQRADPSNNANNPISGESQSYDMQSANSQSGASGAGQFSADSNLESQSVVKQIIIDEDEFFKVTGISFIILLIILTIGLYYREDIREMKSKL